MVITSIVSVERLQEIASVVPEQSDVALAQMAPVPASWPHSGAIDIQNLRLRYRSDLPWVLKGISLRIQPGEHIGVVGRTGMTRRSGQVLFAVILV
jgi:ABC-type bacteriocin/lantibiotic exporter with double-glycine peptidase domain